MNVIENSTAAKVTGIIAYSGEITTQNMEQITEEVRRRHMEPREMLLLDVLQPEIDVSRMQLIWNLVDTLEKSGGVLVIIKSRKPYKPKQIFDTPVDKPSRIPRLTPWEESRWLKKS